MTQLALKLSSNYVIYSVQTIYTQPNITKPWLEAGIYNQRILLLFKCCYTGRHTIIYKFISRQVNLNLYLISLPNL